MENIHNADALATSDQVRIENISANQKFEAFITSLAHIVEKHGMTVLNAGDGSARKSQLYIKDISPK